MCMAMFLAALFTIAKIWKQPKCPSTEEWIKKIWYVHRHIPTHTRMLLRHEKEWNFAVCKNMDGVGGYYDKWNKSDRERQTLNFITYIWSLKNKTN